MPRIPDDELDRIKNEIDLAALVRSRGIELNPHGSKDLVGLSPFSEEKTPSFIVSPHKNLWHCMSSGKGGSVIDFIIQYDGVSFLHAVELLRNGSASKLMNGSAPAKKATVPKLEPPVSFNADDQTLFAQVLDYYHERLKQSPSALEYLKSRGITEEAIDHFKLGFADRTLGLRLPAKNRVDGQEIRTRLQKIGLYRESGHEHFNGCIVFPIRDESGNITELYGRKANNKQKNGIYHLYLPGPHRGLFNLDALKSPDIILTESIVDALSFWCNGHQNVTCIYGTEGFTDDHEEAVIKRKTKRIYLAYDRDKAGDRAAERDAQRLTSIGVDCFRVQFPHGQDANEYALKVTPAKRSLQVLINAAQPIFSSTKILAANVSSSDATKYKIASESPVKPDNAVKLAKLGEDFEIALADRIYRIRGLQKNSSFEVLKINLRVMCNERFYLDVVDLYRAKDRQHFIHAASEELAVKKELIKSDLGKVMLALEKAQEERLNAAIEPEVKIVEISESDQKQALDLLKDPDLLSRILSDFDKCGIVGESTNKLTGYLAAVSRKLDKPLAIIIQSTSAAGKTSLMEAVLEMMPEEERIKYSAMTGQSLYYLGETNLKHRILAIVEEEGAEKASYALKLLQSEGELTIASTGKDDQGRMKTEEYHVEGPVMIFLTTTAIDIDEELLNRCIVLTVDESREQTRAIHQLQREAETLKGWQRKKRSKQILNTHQNAQRLLKPYAVINPFAEQLTFIDDQTRTRRDHIKYLTLIRTITLLHQYQREIKHDEDGMPYLETSLADIKAANSIAHEVLGRSLDELPPQTRRMLLMIKTMVQKSCKDKGIELKDFRFSRRHVREFTGWTEFQVRTHMNKLVDLEYVIPYYAGRGQSFDYELLFDGNEKAQPHLNGLIDVQKLKTTMRGSSIKNGTSSKKTTRTSPERAWIEPSSSMGRDRLESTQEQGLKVQKPKNGQKRTRLVTELVES